MLPDFELYKYSSKSINVISETAFSPILNITYSNGVKVSKTISRDITGRNPYIDYASIIKKLRDLHGFVECKNYTEIFSYKSMLIYFDFIKMDILVENIITANVFTNDFLLMKFDDIELFIESFVNNLDAIHRETGFYIAEKL